MAATSISAHLQVLVLYHEDTDSFFQLFDQSIHFFSLFLDLLHVLLHLFLDGLQRFHKEGVFSVFIFICFMLIVVVGLMLHTAAMGCAFVFPVFPVFPVFLAFLFEFVVLVYLANLIF